MESGLVGSLDMHAYSKRDILFLLYRPYFTQKNSYMHKIIL